MLPSFSLCKSCRTTGLFKEVANLLCGHPAYNPPCTKVGADSHKAAIALSAAHQVTGFPGLTFKWQISADSDVLMFHIQDNLRLEKMEVWLFFFSQKWCIFVAEWKQLHPSLSFWITISSSQIVFWCLSSFYNTLCDPRSHLLCNKVEYIKKAKLVFGVPFPAFVLSSHNVWAVRYMVQVTCQTLLRQTEKIIHSLQMSVPWNVGSGNSMWFAIFKEFLSSLLQNKSANVSWWWKGS